MKRMHLWGWVFLAIWLAGSAQAWQPSGWIYWDWPWAYDSASGDWHWFAADNPQWLYAFPPGDGWAQLPHSGIAQGWSFWNGEWAYDSDNGVWCWRNSGGTQWCLNMSTLTWSVFGQPALDWKPGQSIGPVALGNTYAAVRASMGAPTEVRQTDDDGEITLWSDYEGQELSISYTDTNGNNILDDQDTVDGIHAWNLSGTSPLWNYRGIAFGSTLATAEAVLGAPNLTLDDTAWWFALGTCLIYDNGELSWIYIHFGF